MPTRASRATRTSKASWPRRGKRHHRQHHRKHHRGGGALTTGKIRHVLNEAIPFDKAVSECAQNLTWGVNTATYTGMQVGINTYVQTAGAGAWTLSRQAATPYAAYSTATTGASDITDIVFICNGSANPTGVTAGTKALEVDFSRITGTFLNHSNCQCVVKIYECVFRKVRSGLSNTTLSDTADISIMWQLSLTQDALSMNDQLSPFDSPTFCQHVKVLKRHVHKLGQGEDIQIHASAHMKKGQYQKLGVLCDSATSKYSRHLLVFVHGVLSHDNVSKSVVTSSGNIDVQWRGKVQGRIVNIGSVTQIGDTQYMGSITGTEEVAPGNAQNPTTVVT